jgi:hypothetical protein
MKRNGEERLRRGRRAGIGGPGVATAHGNGKNLVRLEESMLSRRGQANDARFCGKVDMPKTEVAPLHVLDA